MRRAPLTGWALACLAGSALTWLAAGVPARASELPRVRLVRDGGARSLPSAVTQAGGTAREAPAGAPDSVRAARGDAAQARREYPHDLYLPGARREPWTSVVSRIRAPRDGIAAAAPPAAAAPAAPTAPRTLRLAIFRVDFLSDRAGAASTGDGRFDLRTGTDIPIDPPPHDVAYAAAHAEALRRYYAAQSYGGLEIVPTILPADPAATYRLSDLADYGPWAVSQAEDVIRAAETFVTDAVRAVEASGEVRFGDFDAYVVLHAGADFQGDVNRDSPLDLPSFNLTFGESLLVHAGTPDSARVGRVLVLPEAVSQDGRLAALNGVFAHEIGHTLGLPDLYNIFNGVPQVGYWSLMDSGENISALVEDPATGEAVVVDGLLPASLDPWCKLQIFPETVSLLEVQESWEGTREAVEVNPEILFLGIDDREYFLVENRALDLDGSEFPFVRQDSTTGVILGPVDAPDSLGLGPGGSLEYDAALPGGGILIWHIDEKILFTAYFFTGGVNFQTGYRGVAVEEADGIADQGRFNLGLPQDTFCSPNPNDYCFNPLFAPNTVPGSAANDGAWSGITVETRSPSGRFMDLTATRGQARRGWPIAVTRTDEVFVTLGSSVPVDLDASGAPELAFQLEIDVAAEGALRRGVAAAQSNGTGFDSKDPDLTDPPPDNRIGYVFNPLLPGLTGSSSFELTAGSTAGVVAAADNAGRPYLWTEDDIDSKLTGFLPAANVLPVLLDRPTGEDWVLVAGTGSVHALTVPATVVWSDTSRLAPGRRAVAGPCVMPGGGCVVEWYAVGFEGGVLELFGTSECLDLSPPPWRGRPFGSAIKDLAGGYLGVGTAGEPLLAVLTEDSLAVVSPQTGDLAAWALPEDETISLPLAIGDVDRDGFSEIVVATDQGTLLVYNGDGSTALGWPRHVPAPVRDVVLVDVNGNGVLDLLALDGAGRLQGLDGKGRLLPDFPRALGAYTIESAAVVDLDGDGRLTWTASHDDSLLAVRLPGAARLPGDWPMRGGRSEGGSFQPAPTGVLVARVPDLGPADLLVHPNPVRGDGVEIRFHLNAGETATLALYDPTGTEITDARLVERGQREGENAVRWQTGDVAPGLYFCRVERKTATTSRVDLAKIVVLR